MSHDGRSLLREFPSRRVQLSRQTKDPNAVDTTSTAYDEMFINWELIEDLCEGRDQMILKQRRWLPQERGEEISSYSVRLERTFLFGGFCDTLEHLAAKPFAREVRVKNADRIPERLQPLLENVDLMGTDLTAFGKKILKDGEKYGHSLVLVDMPPLRQDLTLAQELETGARPYWVHISPPNLIGWRSQVLGGQEQLTQIRYRETRIENDGVFGDKPVNWIRIITAPPVDAALRDDTDAEELRFGTIQEFRQTSNDANDPKFTLVTSRFHTYPGIPLVWLPLNPTGAGLLRSKPPLQELAEVNLEHWQKSSDLSNILRFVAIAMVLLKGMETSSTDEEDTGGPDDVQWGVNQVLIGPADADGKYIEHSGAGVASLAAYITKLEERMEALGMAPLLARQTDVTATAQRKDDAKMTSSVQSWIRRLETTYSWLFRVSATWIGEDPEIFNIGAEGADEDAISFDVFNEFGLKVATRDDADQLLKARMGGEISGQTFVEEWKKRGLIGEEVDTEEELRRIEEEALANAALVPDLEPDPDDDQNDDGTT